MEKKFKAFERIIWRDNNEDLWDCDLYSYYNKEREVHVTFNHVLADTQILPYEGNEHLVGTTDEPDEEVRLEEGEYCFFSNEVDERAEMWIFDKFKSLFGNTFYSIGSDWIFVIKFSDFNPNDMENTKSKILCVKNGKIIRYKG